MNSDRLIWKTVNIYIIKVNLSFVNSQSYKCKVFNINLVNL